MRLPLKYPNVDLSEAITYINDLEFVKVKTKYAADGWSALSLQGFGYKPSDILKPNVLGSKTDLDHVVETKMYQHPIFESIRKIVDVIPSNKERVRLMKLSASTKIAPHTDKVDKDFVKRKIVRIHIPITDNEDLVEYVVWKDGEKFKDPWGFSKYYYLDVRQKHSVVNKDIKDRINIVADVFVNDKISQMIGF